MNIYDFINWFFMYSFLGYLLECIVLSAEYKRPVVDRGFGHGPFCVIYGFGAWVHACFCGLFPAAPWSSTRHPWPWPLPWNWSQPILWYGCSAPSGGTTATNPLIIKEWSVWKAALHGDFWACFSFYFLDIRVRAAVISLPGHVGTVLAVGLTMFYLVDFIHCFRLRMGGMEEEDEPAVGRLKIY